MPKEVRFAHRDAACDVFEHALAIARVVREARAAAARQHGRDFFRPVVLRAKSEALRQLCAPRVERAHGDTAGRTNGESSEWRSSSVTPSSTVLRPACENVP